MPSPEEQISAILHSAFAVAGDQLVTLIQQEIGNAYPPASEPATPPHLRSGELQSGIRFTVDEFHDGVTLSVFSDAEYSAFLRDGTSRMVKRDFFGEEAVARYAPIVVQTVQQFFTSTGNPPPVVSSYGTVIGPTAGVDDASGRAA